MTYIQQGETWATTRSKINQVIKVSYTDLLADTELTYTGGASGTVTAGDLYPTTEGNWFEVAASDAVDQHITTAGGVKLYEAGPHFSTRARAAAAWARMVARSETPSVGTVWTWPSASITYDGVGTDVPGFSGWSIQGNTAALSAFGAAGDTVISATGTLTSGTDDTTAIQAAADWANAARGRKLVGDDGAIYRITSAITGTGDLRIDLGSARIFSIADARILDWSATLYGPYNLATDYTAGDLSIDLTGDPLPVAPLKGTVMKIVSDGVDPGNRDEGSNTNQYRIGEWFVVGSGSTTTNIVLDRPLRFTRAISPTSTAGDEAEVDSYTTALSARVVYADPDEVFEFIGGVVGHEYGHDASWTGDAIHVTGFTRPRVLTHVQKCYGSGVRPYGTIDADVSGCTFSDFRSDRGYGVSDAGRNTLATDLRGTNIRHIYSSSVSAVAAGGTDPAVLIGAGRVPGAKVGGHGEAGVFAHWDTHHSSDGATMVDAISEGSGLWSHAARGRGIDIVRPKSRNCYNGIYVFTEYDSGDPDEDYFTAGKTAADFTSARVIDPDIECDEEPLVFANATAKMSGNGKFSAADHCMIYNNGSSVIIEGHHDFTAKAGAVSHSRTGCIDLDEANSNNGGALVTTLIIEGTVLIDARNASAGTVYGLNLAANCQVIVRGRLKFNLPFGSTLQTGSGTLTVEGDGVVEHYNGTTLQDVIIAPNAVKTPEMFGASEGATGATNRAAFAAMISSISTNGGTGVVAGTYSVDDTTINDTTGGSIDWSKCTLVTSAGGQSSEVFVIAPASGDKTTADATLLSACNTIVSAGGWKRGVKTLSGLSAYAGQAIRVASTTDHIDRYGGDDYRYEVYIFVADDEGNLSHPLPFDIPSTVTLTVADREIVRDRVTVRAPKVLVNSGSTARTGGLLGIDRSNTIVDCPRVENTTSATMQILVDVDAFYGVDVVGHDLSGANEDATQYGINHVGVGHRFTRGSARDCRRGIDGTYASHTVIDGGFYPDGVGGHWSFGLTVTGGAFIGCDASNTAPIHIAGGDVFVTPGVTLFRYGAGPWVNQRSDASEIIGTISLIGAKCIADMTAETGTVYASAVYLDQPGGAHNFGRDVSFPNHIVIQNNTFEVLGTGHTGKVELLRFATSVNAADQYLCDMSVDISGNRFAFENGSPAARIAGVRATNWTGAGFRFSVHDVPDLEVYWAAASGHSTNTDARAVWNGSRLGDLNFRTDYEATHKYLLDCDDFTTSAAAGATSAVGDEEWWHKINGGLPQFTIGNIADDAAVSFATGEIYATYMLVELNGASSGIAAQFAADSSTSTGVTVHWSTGTTVGTYGTALSGTTGTDVQLNIGAANGLVYVENRTGAAQPFVLVKVQEG